MEIIKDSQCSINTPVTLGREESVIYGKDISIYPRISGKREKESDRRIYLEHLFPLESYDRIIVLFSGGKDSLAAYLKLLEWGVPKNRIELWHHDIDGGHPSRRMDWPVTASYVRAFADAEGVKLRRSWRQDGFWGEVYRQGASMPVQYDDENDTVSTVPLTERQKRSSELRNLIQDGHASLQDIEELKSLGYRMKFPAKTGNLMTRWCSAYLKIMVAESVIRTLDKVFKSESQGDTSCRILVVSGERRGESAGRAKYNEMELHRTNAVKRSKRIVHQWRPVIDHSERDIWEIIRRHNVTPHPCYSAGWNRCSCMMCIFSLSKHWAGIKDLFPEEVEAVKNDEETLGFTLDNKKSLEEYIGSAESCLYSDNRAIEQIRSGIFPIEDMYTENWKFPAGAFKGSAGGPC